jgi:DNA-binding transcriptional regulator YhcF (GntR family)
MQWKPDKDRPLCPQIYEHICVKIVSGELQPNQKLMSVREMALQTGVNPNTVQRSFEMLYRDGIIYSIPASGWYVSDDTTSAKQTLKCITDNKVKMFFEEMSALGLDTEEIKNYIKEWGQ